MAGKKTKKSVETPVLEQVSAKTKASTKSKSAAKPKEVTAGIIAIDYPTQGEVVSGLHYAIRVGSSKEGQVELSFDNSEWLPCRASDGYWWYDWGYFTPGTYKIVARLLDSNGKVVSKSETSVCKVV
jgi:hypothetical protein